MLRMSILGLVLWLGVPGPAWSQEAGDRKQELAREAANPIAKLASQ